MGIKHSVNDDTGQIYDISFCYNAGNERACGIYVLSNSDNKNNVYYQHKEHPHFICVTVNKTIR